MSVCLNRFGEGCDRMSLTGYGDAHECRCIPGHGGPCECVCGAADTARNTPDEIDREIGLMIEDAKQWGAAKVATERSGASQAVLSGASHRAYNAANNVFQRRERIKLAVERLFRLADDKGRSLRRKRPNDGAGR